MLEGEESRIEGVCAVVTKRGIAEEIAVIEHITTAARSEICNEDWFWIDRSGAAIGVRKDARPLQECSVLLGRENNGIGFASGSDGRAEGAGDGDTVLPRASIDSH